MPRYKVSFTCSAVSEEYIRGWFENVELEDPFPVMDGPRVDIRELRVERANRKRES
jgi:hypothetical protein